MKQNHSSSFSFMSNNINYFITLQQEKSEHISESFLCMFFEKQGYHITNFERKTKYQITNVGVEKIKLSRLLVQRINEFKMNEIQRKSLQ